MLLLPITSHMRTLLRVWSYPLLCLFSAAKEFHPRGILSDLILSGGLLHCCVTGFCCAAYAKRTAAAGSFGSAARVLQWRHLLFAYWTLEEKQSTLPVIKSPSDLRDSNKPPTARCSQIGFHKKGRTCRKQAQSGAVMLKHNVCWLGRTTRE